MTSLDAQLAPELEQRRAQQLYRQRRVVEGPQGPEITVEGRRLLNFCSNDYLGLAADPRLAEALIAGARRYGSGSGASHLINGHSQAHHQLEEELAAFTGRERALLFSTGYMANLGVVSALIGSGDGVFEDRLNHASLLDAGLLSRGRLARYAHGDAESLDQRLQSSRSSRRLVVTDGVFSMDGDCAPVGELAAVAAKHDAWLMVDDAHGLGVLGATGGGVCEHDNLTPEQVPILMGTLGKALGSFGAFVAGSETLIEYLIQGARSYIYTTAMAPAQAEVTRAALRICASEPQRRDHLQALISRFRHGAEQLGLPLMDSTTPIQPLLVGDNRTALELSRSLEEHGILVSAIRPPTVPEGSARLRITFSAAHSESQVDHLLAVLERLWQQGAQ